MEKGVTDITDLVFSQKEEEEEEEEESVGAKQIGEEEENCGGGGEAKNGGIFNTFISGILHQTGSGDEREGTAAGDGEREGTAAGDGGGGLLNNLVSHLPAPLADDAAPATDEASILLHSLVHD